jgi:hypothetical protein
VIRMQELIDDFREDRRQLFEKLPVELAFTRDQFALKPPTPRKQPSLSYGERRRMVLTSEQTAAMESMTDNDLETARRVITGFNDLGQLIEDGFFPGIDVLRQVPGDGPVRRHVLLYAFTDA